MKIIVITSVASDSMEKIEMIVQAYLQGASV